MNTAFRKFMLGARIRDADNSQCLLFQTQNMFSHLQDSVRRFVDPTDCVAAIRTYEDAQIDIHNQMDVDEFYNLLFDRWEAQLLTSEAKSTFRSFFGGQLVQQVTSRECDHVSERLEPFSAIQCDIKGKISLQESLQAYVDGEIMEGDNKYKCSTCDRHVDAVKRACLKDIPDNLIFHLKRFDFNLRTLQRSKINDFFSFPNRIDMRPYTIAQLSSPTEELQEDVFELVGVLVHSGTAESGHYYSYIRERPTQQQSEVWVEFNDDTVSCWDPANLEGSCFGGPDQRQPFDANGVVYEKTYSAYMLFYQRSSTLKEEDAALKSSNATSPLKLRLPPDLADHIANENLSILRRHCLFDSGHISLVLGALESVKASAGGQCSQVHQLESLATNVALNHLDQVFSRAKDIPDFDKLYSHVDGMVHECLNCSIAFYKYLEGHRTPIRMLIQRNPEAVVRQDTADLIIRVLVILKERLPKHYTLSPEQLADSEDFDRTIIGGALQLFGPLWENFHCNLRSWPEVFGFMLSFVQLGHDETLAFMETDHFRGLLLIVAADLALELPQQYARMVQNVQRRMASRTPSYDSILCLLAFLLSKLRPQARRRVPEFIERSDDRRFSQEGGFLPSQAEQRVLYLDWSKGGPNVFIEKLIGLDQSPEATIHILVTLLQLTRNLEEKMFATLRYHISGQITGQAQAPFLKAARLFIRYSTRRDMIEALIEHVALQCNSLQNAEGQSFLSFLEAAFDAPRDGTGESAGELELQGLQHLADWVPSLLGYYDDAVNTSTERFLNDKLFRHGVSPLFQDAQDADSQLQSPVKDDKDVSFDAVVATARSRAMDEAARAIGMACLHFLRDNYVARRVNIGSRLVAPLQRVIACCQKYFEVQDEHVQQASAEFRALKQGTPFSPSPFPAETLGRPRLTPWTRRAEILERLRRLVVDDALEEDASGMSCDIYPPSDASSNVTAGD
jgi:ubiquitin carboxyl-terminal hydrolase 34